MIPFKLKKIFKNLFLLSDTEKALYCAYGFCNLYKLKGGYLVFGVRKGIFNSQKLNSKAFNPAIVLSDFDIYTSSKEVVKFLKNHDDFVIIVDDYYPETYLFLIKTKIIQNYAK